MSDELDLSTDLAQCLTEGTPPSEVVLPVCLPNNPTPPKAPSTAMPKQEEPILNSKLDHPMVNLTLDTKQCQEEGDWIQ